MQEDKKETPASAPAGGKPPGFCDRLQRAFHARPAFQPLRRLAVRHQDGAASKPADAGAGAAPMAEPAPARNKHGVPPVPAPPRPLTPSPSPQPAPVVRLPAVAATRRSNMPTALPVPAPPKDVVTGVPVADPKAGDKDQETKVKNRVGFSVRKALPSK